MSRKAMGFVGLVALASGVAAAVALAQPAGGRRPMGPPGAAPAPAPVDCPHDAQGGSCPMGCPMHHGKHGMHHGMGGHGGPDGKGMPAADVKIEKTKNGAVIRIAAKNASDVADVQRRALMIALHLGADAATLMPASTEK